MKNLILICGDEDFLREKKKQELLDALGAPGSMNYNVFTGTEASTDEVLRLAETLPFMEEQRTILLNDTGILRGAAAEDTVSALKDIPGSTFIIFYEKEYEISNELYKLIKENGDIFSYIKADSRKGKDKFNARTDVKDFVTEKLRSESLSMDGRTASYFLDLVGYDMLNADSELSKLICYMDSKDGNSKSISVDDINAICSRTVTDRVFDMTGLMLSGKRKEAIGILEDLFSLKVPPMRILYVMSKQFDQIYTLKDLREQNISDSVILSRMQIQDWLLRKLTDQSANITKKDARRYLEMCASLEQKVKQGQMQDRLALEILTAF